MGDSTKSGATDQIEPLNQIFPAGQPHALLTETETIAQSSQAQLTSEVLPYYKVWTRVPIIHGVYFTRTICSLVREIRIIRNRRRLKGFVFRHPAKERDQLASPHFAQSDAYYNQKEHLFKVFHNDTPSTYAIDAGLRIFLWKGGWPAVEEDVWNDTASSCIVFIRKMKTKGEWGFSVKENSPPSIFGTLSSLSGLCRCATAKRRPDLTLNMHSWLGDIVKGMMSESIRFEDTAHFAFKRKGAPTGCLTATEQSYRICELLNELGVEHQALDSYLAHKSRKVLQFVKDHWNSDIGCFSKTLRNGATPNLTDTRSALLLLRRLIARGDIKRQDLNWLDLSTVLAFVDSCWSDYGFATVPKGQPSLCSFHQALSIVKAISIFELRSLGKAGAEHTLVPYWFCLDTRLDQALWFARDCIDKDMRVVFMYPRQVLDEWAHSGILRYVELKWMSSNMAILEKYEGAWIALEKDKIIAYGPYEVEVEAEARRSGIKIPFLVRIPSKKEPTFAGGSY